MTISGETIDYGPCAFMEAYDPETVFSSIDFWGRYAYGNQPSVAGWNLARFAEALLPLLSENAEEAVALAEESFGVFRVHYDAAWLSGMRAKLGLSADVAAEVVTPSVDELLVLLKDSDVDYTSFFRHLGQAARGDLEGKRSARGQFIDLAGIDDWMSRWRALSPDAELMDRANPIYIPRNHLVEEALTAATAGDLDPVAQLLDVVTAPYDARPGLDRYASPAPEDFGTYQTFCGT
jgi:serine/tyrosine/threonine adenylyltransferase